MARSIARLDASRAAKRETHWRSIAVSACEQCGRNRIPLVHALSSFEHWIAEATSAKLRVFRAPEFLAVAFLLAVLGLLVHLLLGA